MTARIGTALAAAFTVVAAACSSQASRATTSPATTSTRSHAAAVSNATVAATREAVAPHDNEVMALAPHAGRLFAATDQWMYAGPSPSGQILVRSTSDSPWTVFEQTDSLRVQALDSFAIPANQGLGAGHALLVTQAIVNGHSRVQWLLDGASSFTSVNSFELRSNGVDVRSFGAHESDGSWAVYAGANPTGILRGTWSPTRHTLVFDPVPELRTSASRSAGVPGQKVTGFADCGGALFATIHTKLYRRNDGALPPGATRWDLVYQAPPVGAHNSGLRGLSCIMHDGAPSLLASTEGTGKVFRFDHLARARLTPQLEFAPIAAIRNALAAQHVAIPAQGKGSIVYVIAAYNNFETVNIDGMQRQVFGFEWAYNGRTCPVSRSCGPIAFGAISFDAAACFAIRTDAMSPSYTLRCLSGPDFTPPGRTAPPIRAGQAYVSIRTIKPSPFGDGRLYFAGYDCNFYPADGTAWTASAPIDEVHA